MIGRPPLEPHERQTERVMLRLTPASLAQLQRASEATGLPPSTLARRIVQETLAMAVAITSTTPYEAKHGG